jgi:eukaryotic-like serine/threonine-protein kinase
MTTAPIDDLDGFRILEHAGSGGLGDVFVAERLSTGGKVAIKLLRGDDPIDMERRVHRELRALLALKGHPGVVHIEEVIATRKGPALVMEHAADGSLHGLLARGPFDTATTADVGRQIAALLVDAHRLGIVHRDIKPHNILRTAFGSYKLCDFGIAALTRTPGWAEQTSAVSYRYASPEELDGSTVGPQSDIFSLGVTLVQTRTGTTDGLRTGQVFEFGSVGGDEAELANLLRAMTAARPSDRPPAAQVAAALSNSNRRPGGTSSDPDPDVDSDVDPDVTVPRPRRPAAPEARTMHPLPEPTTEKNWWEAS